VVLDGSNAGKRGVRLASLDAPRRRPRAHAPMVQNLRHMMDMPSAFAHSQGQVMILSSVACRIKQADLVEHAASHREHMADIVVVPQQVEVEIGFEERVEIPSVLPFFVLVAIQEISVRTFENGKCVLIQQVGLDEVVMIEEAHEIARRDGDAGIRVR